MLLDPDQKTNDTSFLVLDKCSQLAVSLQHFELQTLPPGRLATAMGWPPLQANTRCFSQALADQAKGAQRAQVAHRLTVIHFGAKWVGLKRLDM